MAHPSARFVLTYDPTDSTRFVKCEKCHHFFVVLSDHDSNVGTEAGATTANSGGGGGGAGGNGGAYTGKRRGREKRDEGPSPTQRAAPLARKPPPPPKKVARLAPALIAQCYRRPRVTT